MGILGIKLFCNKIITVSPVVKHYLIRKRFNKNIIHMSANGVDVEYMMKLKPYEDDNCYYDAVFLARLAPSKGIFEIPEIWSKVVERCPNARLAMIGNGTPEVKKELQGIIEKYHMERNIQMLGYLENEEAYRFLKSSKVFLFPSHEEGWGISIAEALSCGLPVVAYDLPIYKYIFKYGVFEAPKGNVEKMAELVCDLLMNENLRSNSATKGQNFVLNHYDWNAVSEKELRLILK